MDNQDKIFNKIKSAAQKAEQADFPGMDKVWARVEEKLDKKEDKKAILLWKKLAIAASLLLFVSLGYQILKNDTEINIPKKSNETKIVLENNSTKKDSASPSETIKTEAEEILQKQLEKPNPVAIAEPKTPSKPEKIAVPAVKEEAIMQKEAALTQESDNARFAPAAARSLAPSMLPYQEKADLKLSKTVSGVITDEKDNSPIPGAIVTASSTKKTAVTDVDGKYVIDAEKGEKLVYNMVGYNSRETIVGNSSNLNNKLSPANDALEEVVVVGYGKKSERKMKKAAAAKLQDLKTESKLIKNTVPHIKNALYVINGENYEEASLFGSNPTSPYAPIDNQIIESVKVLSVEEATNYHVGNRKVYSKVILISTKNGIPLKR